MELFSSLKSKAFRRRVENIISTAEKKGIDIELDVKALWDAKHLNCIWYGGHIGSISVGCYRLDVCVNGDVLVTGKVGNKIIYYRNREGCGAEGSSLANVIGSDSALEEAIGDELLYLNNNNWIELVFTKDGKVIYEDVYDDDENVLAPFEDASVIFEYIRACESKAS